MCLVLCWSSQATAGILPPSASAKPRSSVRIARLAVLLGRLDKITDPPRILEPGKWGSKVRGLAHVQGYRGPQGYAFWNLQVPVPNLSTASRLGRFQVPNLSTSSRFFKHFIFVLLLAAKSLNCGSGSDVGINDRTMAEGSDAMPEQSEENQPPQTHSARDHVPPAEMYVPSVWSSV